MRDEGDLGTLAAGSLADLILVDGDPLKDLSVLNRPGRIALVIKDGAIQKISPALAATAATPALEAAE